MNIEKESFDSLVTKIPRIWALYLELLMPPILEEKFPQSDEASERHITEAIPAEQRNEEFLAVTPGDAAVVKLYHDLQREMEKCGNFQELELFCKARELKLPSDEYMKTAQEIALQDYFEESTPGGKVH